MTHERNDAAQASEVQWSDFLSPGTIQETSLGMSVSLHGIDLAADDWHHLPVVPQHDTLFAN